MTNAKTRIRFTAGDDEGVYVVELHRGQVSACIGRVIHCGATWMGIAIGADSSTPYFSTRKAAVDAMRRGDTYLSMERARRAHDLAA